MQGLEPQPRTLRAHWLLILMLLGPGSTAGGELDGQREAFVKAEQALKQGRSAEYRRLKSQLQDYPLLPYLRFQELTGQKAPLNDQQASAFLAEHAETPLADRFRRYLLNTLGKHQRWESYLRFYQPTDNTKRQCYFLQALIATGQQQLAIRQVEPLWLSAHSQPKACDPVFTAWKSAGGLTPDLVWRRIELAMAAGETRLARYLGKQLPHDQQPWMARWLEVHRQPATSAKLDFSSEPTSVRQAITTYGLRRLSRKDPDAALSAWERLRQEQAVTEDQHYQVERDLALALLRKEHPQALAFAARLTPDADDHYLLERRIRGALSVQAWQQTLEWINALPASLADSERWRYWRARSLEALGADIEADSIYRDLAGNRGYYGFMAADRSNQEYNLRHIPLEVEDELIQRLAEREGMRRTRELLTLKRTLNARREWRYAIADLDPDELQAASKLAESWGWLSQAIFTLARTGYWDDLELRFPLHHRQQVTQAAGRRQLDDAWIYAVIRQESAFANNAVSSAGAYGLMQLMPRTARSTARKLKRGIPKIRDLLEPETNILLGTSYLKSVFEQLDGNPVLATSAYNAGPYRVKSWLPDETLAADLWIELIPFKETRRYTQRVLSYAVIYEQRLGKETTRMQHRMPPVSPRASATARASLPAGAPSS